MWIDNWFYATFDVGVLLSLFKELVESLNEDQVEDPRS